MDDEGDGPAFETVPPPEVDDGNSQQMDDFDSDEEEDECRVCRGGSEEE